MASSMTVDCPHCGYLNIIENSAFCYHCRLFLVPEEKLEMDKGAPIDVWLKKQRNGYLN